MKAGLLLGAVSLMVAAVPLAGWGMSGHMAAHMIAVALAAPVLALALEGSWAELAGMRSLLGNAMAMSVLELAVVWCWHLPALRAAAAQAPWLHFVELGCFLVAGTLLWSAVLARASGRLAGIGALLLTSMHMTLLGALIGLAPRTLYPAMPHALPTGLSPLQDQQLAGVVMLLVGGVSYLVGALALLRSMLSEGHQPA